MAEEPVAVPVTVVIPITETFGGALLPLFVPPFDPLLAVVAAELEALAVPVPMTDTSEGETKLGDCVAPPLLLLLLLPLPPLLEAEEVAELPEEVVVVVAADEEDEPEEPLLLLLPLLLPVMVLPVLPFELTVDLHDLSSRTASLPST